MPSIVAIGLLLVSLGVDGPAPELPDNYVLDYPPVEKFCPPIRSAFFDAANTLSTVNGRRFRHQPNGGYGLPIVQKVDDQHLIHVGADLGWRLVGEPVFAVAGGVVRLSEGPRLEESEASRERRQASDRTANATYLAWGNLVAIEHRNEKNEFLTTVYGHLGADRLVNAGDIVTAGQQIGTIGRRHRQINGDYDPHLHFGVREGRIAEVGAVLSPTNRDASQGIVLAALSQETIELTLPTDMQSLSALKIGDESYALKTRNGKTVAPAKLLWRLRPPSFAIVGYSLSTEGWRDPIAFLRDNAAHTNPAPFHRGPRPK